MTLTEILPSIHALSRTDKLRLIQFLAADVAHDEGIMLDFAGKTVPLWSPYDAVEGASALLQALEQNNVAR